MELFHLFIDHQKSWNLSYHSRGHCGHSLMYRPEHELRFAKLPFCCCHAFSYGHCWWLDLRKRQWMVQIKTPQKEWWVKWSQNFHSLAQPLALMQSLLDWPRHRIWIAYEAVLSHDVDHMSLETRLPCIFVDAKRGQPIVATGFSKLSTVILIFLQRRVPQF